MVGKSVTREEREKEVEIAGLDENRDFSGEARQCQCFTVRLDSQASTKSSEPR